MMLFDWIRNGIRRAIVDGFRDAVVEIIDVGPNGGATPSLDHVSQTSVSTANGTASARAVATPNGRRQAKPNR
jgi:hypothetical protein